MVYKNIFFDFDGVIAESVAAKTDAFREMYAHYGNDIADKVVDYHVKNGGVSRFEKFKYWEKTFFNREMSEEVMRKKANEFSNLVLKKVINAPEVDGAKYFIKKYYKKIKYGRNL